MKWPQKVVPSKNELEGLDKAIVNNRHEYVRMRTVEGAGLVRVTAPRKSPLGHRWSSGYDPERCQKVAAAHSRRKMREIARANRPTRLITLTFGENCGPQEASKEWDVVMRKGRNLPSYFYIRVAEWGSEEGRLHFHVLADEALTEYLRNVWIAGYVDVKRIPFSELDRVCNYLAKDFADPGRPYKRRYVARRGAAPSAQEFFCDSIEDALRIAQGLADTDPANVSSWVSDSGFGTYAEVSWDPRR
jgi:hypothetical protein